MEENEPQISEFDQMVDWQEAQERADAFRQTDTTPQEEDAALRDQLFVAAQRDITNELDRNFIEAITQQAVNAMGASRELFFEPLTVQEPADRIGRDEFVVARAPEIINTAVATLGADRDNERQIKELTPSIFSYPKCPTCNRRGCKENHDKLVFGFKTQNGLNEIVNRLMRLQNVSSVELVTDHYADRGSMDSLEFQYTIPASAYNTETAPVVGRLLFLSSNNQFVSTPETNSDFSLGYVIDLRVRVENIRHPRFSMGSNSVVEYFLESFHHYEVQLSI